jgi:hypothetical protein
MMRQKPVPLSKRRFALSRVRITAAFSMEDKMRIMDRAGGANFRAT